MSKVKKRSRLLAESWVRKSNGKLERYNRSKLRSSILKAGATRRQAQKITTLITNNVRRGNFDKNINGKKEIPSINL